MDRAWRYVKVWDGWVRLFHWSLVLLVLLSWGSAQSGAWKLHFFSGYSILTLVAFRLLWGLFGSENARFRYFLRSPLAALAHLSHLRRPGPDTEVTHNPAGGWMVVGLLALLLAQITTGLFADPDDFVVRGPFANRLDAATSYAAYGLHARLFNLLLIAIGLHLAAIFTYRIIKGHDLVFAMLTGRKRLPGDIAAPRLAPARLGAALLVLVALAVFLLSRLGAGA